MCVMVLVFEWCDVFVKSSRLVNMTQKPVRVLQVIGAMDRGGAETLLMNLYRNIDRNLVQFDFLVNEENSCDYDSEIQGLGGRIFRIPRYKLFNYCSYKTACKRFFSQHIYPIVHGHIGFPASIYLNEASKTGAYTIAHSHAQNYPISPNEILFRVCARPVRHVADYFLACSKEAGIDRFGVEIVEGPSFQILKNGVDTSLVGFDNKKRAEARAELGLSEDLLVLGHVGRLTEVKNHQFLFKVFNSIHRRNQRSVLLLAGRGELELQLRETVKQMGLSDSIVFLGVRDDIPSLLSAFDLFIFPSFAEGLSCAVIEAQASGLPVLLSNGVPDAARILPTTVRLDLSSGADAWAERALQAFDMCKSKDRNCAKDLIERSGFDIRTSAAWLQELYLQHS